MNSREIIVLSGGVLLLGIYIGLWLSKNLITDLEDQIDTYKKVYGELPERVKNERYE